MTGITFSQPKLSIDNPEVNLGSMYGGEKKKGKIILKNIGNDTLRIFSVQPGCGCTTVKQLKGFLLPGQSGDVELEFNSFGYRGKVEKQVFINTNDPTSQFVTVKLIAKVYEVLQPIKGTIREGSTLFIDNTIIGKPTTQTVELKNVSGVPIVIKGDSVPSSTMALTLNKRSLRPNDTLSIQVTVQPQKVGSAKELFYIFTNHKSRPIVEIQVRYLGIKEN